jgi:hypothetical protein
MTSSVSFEIVKLLKEKGYPFEFITVGELKEVPLNIPTIAEVVMWLYDKHQIWVRVSADEWDKDEDRNFDWWITSGKYSQMDGGFSSPTEAYEHAIKYTLENLIQNSVKY